MGENASHQPRSNDDPATNVTDIPLTLSDSPSDSHIQTTELKSPIASPTVSEEINFLPTSRSIVVRQLTCITYTREHLFMIQELPLSKMRPKFLDCPSMKDIASKNTDFSNSDNVCQSKKFSVNDIETSLDISPIVSPTVSEEINFLPTSRPVVQQLTLTYTQERLLMIRELPLSNVRPKFLDCPSMKGIVSKHIDFNISDNVLENKTLSVLNCEESLENTTVSEDSNSFSTSRPAVQPLTFTYTQERLLMIRELPLSNVRPKFLDCPSMKGIVSKHIDFNISDNMLENKTLSVLNYEESSEGTTVSEDSNYFSTSRPAVQSLTFTYTQERLLMIKELPLSNACPEFLKGPTWDVAILLQFVPNDKLLRIYKNCERLELLNGPCIVKNILRYSREELFFIKELSLSNTRPQFLKQRIMWDLSRKIVPECTFFNYCCERFLQINDLLLLEISQGPFHRKKISEYIREQLFLIEKLPILESITLMYPASNVLSLVEKKIPTEQEIRTIGIPRRQRSKCCIVCF